MKYVLSLRTVGMSRETTKYGMKNTQDEILEIECDIFLCCIRIDSSYKKNEADFCKKLPEYMAYVASLVGEESSHEWTRIEIVTTLKGSKTEDSKIKFVEWVSCSVGFSLALSTRNFKILIWSFNWSICFAERQHYNSCNCLEVFTMTYKNRIPSALKSEFHVVDMHCKSGYRRWYFDQIMGRKNEEF